MSPTPESQSRYLVEMLSYRALLPTSALLPPSHLFSFPDSSAIPPAPSSPFPPFPAAPLSLRHSTTYSLTTLVSTYTFLRTLSPQPPPSLAAPSPRSALGRFLKRWPFLFFVS